MSTQSDIEAIMDASICYHKVFKKTIIKSIPKPKLTRSQMDILVTLHDSEEPLMMSDISRRVSVAREQVTRTVKTLKEQGFVETTRGEEDGRNMSPSLTAKGRSYIEKQRKATSQLIQEYLDRMSEEDRHILIDCSRKAVEVFKRNGEFPNG